MPKILLILFEIRPSFIDLIIGTPPATEASYSRFTLFFSAIRASSSPYFAIKDLFAVITCFLFLNAEKISFLATPSAPPTSSTIISTSFSYVKSNGFFINLFLGI